MADKHLTELEWKKFAKGKGYKDAPLVQAIARLEAAKAPADQVQALTDIEKQSDTLRKANKGDKELAGYLDELDKTLSSRLVSAKGAAKMAEAKSKGKDSEAGEEDEDGPAALTTGLASMLKMVMKEVPMHGMVVTDGKLYGVMLSRRPMAPTRSKLLKDYLQLGAIKPPILAQCIFEKNAVTFVVEQVVGGMAKKIAKALLDQTERRWKVRVRGQDPNDVDEDLEDEGTEASAGEVPVAPPEAPADASAALVQAMAKLSPAIKRVVAARPDVKGGLLQSVASFQAQIKAGDLAAARETLMETAGLVKRLDDQLGETGTAGKVRFEQVHLDWDSRKSTVEGRLAQLNDAILAEDDIPEGPSAAAKLGRVLARFNEGLGDTLDELRNATDAAERKRLSQKAQGIADRYLAYLSDDALVAHVEENPYDIAVDVRGTLSPPLQGLKSQLESLVA